MVHHTNTWQASGDCFQVSFSRRGFKWSRMCLNSPKGNNVLNLSSDVSSEPEFASIQPLKSSKMDEHWLCTQIIESNSKTKRNGLHFVTILGQNFFFMKNTQHLPVLACIVILCSKCWSVFILFECIFCLFLSPGSKINWISHLL